MCQTRRLMMSRNNELPRDFCKVIVAKHTDGTGYREIITEGPGERCWGHNPKEEERRCITNRSRRDGAVWDFRQD